jgi:hypothetical protein
MSKKAYTHLRVKLNVNSDSRRGEDAHERRDCIMYIYQQKSWNWTKICTLPWKLQIHYIARSNPRCNAIRDMYNNGTQRNTERALILTYHQSSQSPTSQ